MSIRLSGFQVCTPLTPKLCKNLQHALATKAELAVVWSSKRVPQLWCLHALFGELLYTTPNTHVPKPFRKESC